MYIGNKNIPGVIELLVNNLPKSSRYFSLFFGSGGLENSVYTSGANWVCAEKDEKCMQYQSAQAVIEFKCYKVLLAAFVFNNSDFIFADPPYMFSSRRSEKSYYKHEFNDTDHEHLLKKLVNLNCRVMLTHPKSELYMRYLAEWTCVPFTYQSRQGLFEDCLWLNYDPAGLELINYNALGSNFVERQAIKRKRSNFVRKFKELSFHERASVIAELNYTCSN